MALATCPRPRPAAPDPALLAYEAMAPFYDRFTADYDYARWLAGIEQWAQTQGLHGRRLLDVACGTGKSFAPMLARGYHVTACDLSPAMVAEARRKWGGGARIHVEDMRRLPWRSTFDLVTCLDDAVNYLLTRDDLASALGSMARVLRPGGVLVFDTNSLRTYRSTFAQTFQVASDGWRFTWQGDGSAGFKPGGVATARVTAKGAYPGSPSKHVQRHWPIAELRAACQEAGFGHITFRGQVTGARLMGEPDEDEHTKIMCLAVKRTHMRVVGGTTPPWHAERTQGRYEGGSMVIKA